MDFILIGGVDNGNKAAIAQSQLIKWNKLPNIKWLGHRTDIAELYNHCHIAVLPSYREGLPKSLIEACAIGRPIVTTDVPGCREVVDDGINGFLVKPRDFMDLAEKIQILLNDQSLRSTMGRASRVKAENEFGIRRIVEQTFDVYNHSLN